jgi:diguanylate cyclase (GGDEF)-like protein
MPRRQVIVSGIGLLGVVVAGLLGYVLDELAQDNLPLTLLYLAPVIFVSWFGRKLHAFLSTIPTAVALWLATRSFAPSMLSQTVTVASQFLTYNMVGMLVSHLRSSQDHERELARRDPLTRLLNTLGFGETATRELVRMRRYSRPVSVLYLDVDDFKLVNDARGHSAGDEALRIVAGAIASSIREVDTAARVGGDEFVVLMPETGYAGMKTAALRIRQHLARVTDGLTLSLGGASFELPPQSVDEMIHEVDDLMYRAKSGGKARAAFLRSGPSRQVEFDIASAS